MNKTSLILAIIARFPDRPIVFTTGYACRIAFGAAPEAQNHFHMMGSMGCASAIARGISMASPTSPMPVVVDGDGAFLMGLHSLSLEKEIVPSPIIHVVANDLLYASTGGQCVPASVRDIDVYARAAGYPSIEHVTTADGLASVLKEERAREAGSLLINAEVEPGPPPPARISVPASQIAERVSEFLAKSHR